MPDQKCEIVKNHYHWTTEIDNYLYEHYGVDSTYDISVYLGVNINTLRSHCRMIGIAQPKKSLFSKKEIDFITDNVDSMSPEEISEILGRPKTSIWRYIRMHGLKARVDTSKYIPLSEANEIVNRDVSTWRGMHIMNTHAGKYVNHEELARYMEKHPTCYDATECDTLFFNVYPFFREKHLQDRKNKCDARWNITA